MNLAIEQMREIMEGEPEGCTHLKFLFGVSVFYSLSSNNEADQAGLWIDDGDDSYWGLSSYQNWELLPAGSRFISINDLRLAIADYDRTDHVTDIRNHIAPTTKVIEG